MSKKWYQNLTLALPLLVLLLFSFATQTTEGQAGKEDLWLVTSRKPALLKTLKRHSDPHYQKGRVFLVTLNKDFGKLPLALQKILRPIRREEVKNYEPKFRSLEAPDPKIVEVLQQVEGTFYTDWLTSMVQYQHRSIKGLTVSDSGNARAVSLLQDVFGSFGYATETHCYRHYTKGDECNVIAEKKGLTLPDEVVLIEGHLDDVGKMQAGADDNASGSIALLEMARILSNYESERTIRFLATNGEEGGLRGSKAYVKLINEAGTLNQIKFVINMDMIAYNQNGKVDLETELEHQDEADWYAEQTRKYTDLTPNISIPAWGSDHVPFLNAGIPAFLTIEYWGTHTPCYHQTCDKLDTLNIDYALEIIRLNLAVAIQKAGVRL